MVVIVLLLFASACSAVTISPDQQGDVLIFPYYTGLSPYSSLVSVSNASRGSIAAVRITFRGRNGEDYSLNTYLAPGAAWVGAVADQGLILGPDQCAFGPGFTPLTSEPVDVPREGFVEVYELGRLDSDRAATDIADQNCGNWVSSTAQWLSGRSALAAQMHLIDAESGTSFSIAPLVLDDFSDVPLHADPAFAGPNLTDANPLRAQFVVDGLPVSTTWRDSLPMINAVLAAYRIESDFTIEKSIGAKHELVLTLPTLDAGGSPGDFPTPLFISGRNRKGTVSSDDGGLAKCTPFFRPPPPFAEQRLTRVVLGGQRVFPGTASEAVHVSPQGNGCGFSTQRAFDELFTAGRVAIQPGETEYVSQEGVVIRGFPLLVASVSTLSNEELGVFPASYGLSHAIDRRQNVERAGLAVSASACRPYSGSLFGMNPRNGTIVFQEGNRGSLLILDANLDAALTLGGPFVDVVFSPGGQTLLAFQDGRIVRLDLNQPELGLTPIEDPPFLPDLPRLTGVSDDGTYVYFRVPDRNIIRYDTRNGDQFRLEAADTFFRGLLAISSNGEQAIVQSSGPVPLEFWDLRTAAVSPVLNTDEPLFLQDPLTLIELLAANPLLDDLVLSVRTLEQRFLYRLNLVEDQLTLLNPENLSASFVDILNLAEPQASLNSSGDGLLTTFLELGTSSVRSNRSRLWRLSSTGDAPERLQLSGEDLVRAKSVGRALMSDDGQVLVAALGDLSDRSDRLCRFDLVH